MGLPVDWASTAFAETRLSISGPGDSSDDAFRFFGVLLGAVFLRALGFEARGSVRLQFLV